MAEKTRIIEIYEKSGAFTSVLKRFSPSKSSKEEAKQEYNYSDLALLRKLFSNEKARLLHTIKTKKPTSIYSLAKLLGRDFKSVRDDVILLKKFGFLDLVQEKSKTKRISHRPVLNVSSINVIIRI
jgi:predicted transcriptional regulator